MKKVFILISVVLTVGCEYVPREEFKVLTIDGSVLTFLCPVIDPNRNNLTYIYDSDCVLTAVDNAE